MSIRRTVVSALGFPWAALAATPTDLSKLTCLTTCGQANPKSEIVAEIFRQTLATAKCPAKDWPLSISRGWLHVRVTLSPLRTARKSRTNCNSFDEPAKRLPGSPPRADAAQRARAKNTFFHFINCFSPDLSLALLHLDPAEQGLVDDRCELNDVLAAGIGIHGELLDDGLILSPRRREDIEIAQYLRAVDSHVEFPSAGGVEVSFGEM